MQTNKRLKKGFKIKGAKERRVLWSGAPDGVRCTRTVQLQTRHPRVSLGVLCYNSSDCPVCQWSNGSFAQRSTAKAADSVNSEEQCAQKSEQSPEAHQTVNSACLVRHRTVRCHKKTKLQRSTAPEP
jgi:hypothetical protein